MIISCPKTSSARVSLDGVVVVLTIDGRSVTLPWEAAVQLGTALLAKGRLAEEVVKAEQITFDQALLLRSGATPVGLTSHPKIIADAEREAAWNSKLRRSLPGGVRSESKLGIPSIIQGSRKHDS